MRLCLRSINITSSQISFNNTLLLHILLSEGGFMEHLFCYSNQSGGSINFIVSKGIGHFFPLFQGRVEEFFAALLKHYQLACFNFWPFIGCHVLYWRSLQEQVSSLYIPLTYTSSSEVTNPSLLYIPLSCIFIIVSEWSHCSIASAVRILQKRKFHSGTKDKKDAARLRWFLDGYTSTRSLQPVCHSASSKGLLALTCLYQMDAALNAI